MAAKFAGSRSPPKKARLSDHWAREIFGAPAWVAVRDYDGQDLLYVTQILAWRCGLARLQSAVNDEADSIVRRMYASVSFACSRSSRVGMVTEPPGGVVGKALCIIKYRPPSGPPRGAARGLRAKRRLGRLLPSAFNPCQLP